MHRVRPGDVLVDEVMIVRVVLVQPYDGLVVPGRDKKARLEHGDRVEILYLQMAKMLEFILVNCELALLFSINKDS